MPLQQRADLEVLARSAGVCGSISLALGAASALVAGELETIRGVVLTVCSVIAIVSMRLMRGSKASTLVFACAAVVAMLGVMLALHMPADPPLARATALSATIIAGGAMPFAAAVLLAVPWGIPIAAAAMAADVWILIESNQGAPRGIDRIVFAMLGCAIILAAAVLALRIVPRGIRRIADLGGSFAAERLATEAEGERRASARLLHDTVLATLTLLAHGGRGTDPEALRRQASGDAELLRTLREGDVPQPKRSGSYSLETTESGVLTTTLAGLDDRFAAAGLRIRWNGAGDVRLPSAVLDDLMLAIAECLENVRRHAEVDEAGVTVTQGDTAVQVMITDQGVGFDTEGVDPARLGFAESVVGRLRAHGGSARVFSALGAGTTVILEVPSMHDEPTTEAGA